VDPFHRLPLPRRVAPERNGAGGGEVDDRHAGSEIQRGGRGSR
jgi:hypothetical protein